LPERAATVLAEHVEVVHLVFGSHRLENAKPLFALVDLFEEHLDLLGRKYQLQEIEFGVNLEFVLRLLLNVDGPQLHLDVDLGVQAVELVGFGGVSVFSDRQHCALHTHEVLPVQAVRVLRDEVPRVLHHVLLQLAAEPVRSGHSFFNVLVQVDVLRC